MADRAAALALLSRKEDMEAELDAIVSELSSPPPSGGEPAGVTEPLVDAEGFPRADVDLFRVRRLRNRYHHLRNDLKAVMREIEGSLHLLLAAPAAADEEGPAAAAAAAAAADEPPPAPQPAAAEPALRPFARVESVAAGSPAAEAGLEPGDLVLRFGSCTAANSPTLAPVGQAVQLARGTEMAVRVRRGEPPAEHALGLTPRPWGGRGLLGCHIVEV